jgi:hypothetical protein
VIFLNILGADSTRPQDDLEVILIALGLLEHGNVAAAEGVLVYLVVLHRLHGEALIPLFRGSGGVYLKEYMKTRILSCVSVWSLGVSARGTCHCAYKLSLVPPLRGGRPGSSHLRLAGGLLGLRTMGARGVMGAAAVKMPLKWMNYFPNILITV